MHLFKRSKKKLYTKILIWAYKKGQNGFSKGELYKQFTDLNEQWAQQVLFRGSDNDRGLFDVVEKKEDWMTTIYSLTDKGMSAVAHQQELDTANRGGYFAIFLGISALGVSIITMNITQKQLESAQTQIKLSYDAISLATKPQLDIYLRNDGKLREGTQEDKIIFGIKNVGLSTIKNIEVISQESSLEKEKCLKEENSMIIGWTEQPLERINELKPGEKKEKFFNSSVVSGKDLKVFTFYVSYNDGSTDRFFSRKRSFFLELSNVYTQDNMPRTSDFEKLSDCAESVKMGTFFSEGDIVHSIIEE